MTFLLLSGAAVVATVVLVRVFRGDRHQSINGTPWLRAHFDAQDAERRRREAGVVTRGGR